MCNEQIVKNAGAWEKGRNVSILRLIFQAIFMCKCVYVQLVCVCFVRLCVYLLVCVFVYCKCLCVFCVSVYFVCDKLCLLVHSFVCVYFVCISVCEFICVCVCILCACVLKKT